MMNITGGAERQRSFALGIAVNGDREFRATSLLVLPVY